MTRALVQETVSTLQDARHPIQKRIDLVFEEFNGRPDLDKNAAAHCEFLQNADYALQQMIDYLEANMPEE